MISIWRAGIGLVVSAASVACASDDDAATVDERHAEAGLPPLAEYFAKMTAVCADAG